MQISQILRGGVLLARARELFEKKVGLKDAALNVEIVFNKCIGNLIHEEEKKVGNLTEEIKESRAYIKALKDDFKKELEPLNDEIHTWMDERKKSKEKIKEWKAVMKGEDKNGNQLQAARIS